MWGLAVSFMSYAQLSPLPFLAANLGTTEPALRLLISILMAYPTAVFYQKYIRPVEEVRNIYFIVTGVDIAYFNFGLSMLHNVVPFLVIYISTKILGPGKLNVIVTFVFNMAYLLTGYVTTESEDYDITWTMPHCVLTLKLIALSFDLWDGQKMVAGIPISDNNKKTALVNAPTFPELVGFIYFPSCFLVGPVFSFRRYLDYIKDRFPQGEEEEYFNIAFTKLLQGLGYLVAFQVGVTVFSMKYIQSDEFWETSIFYRHIYCGLWAHFALYKYISCWLLTEASCIRFGLSYNGITRDENNVASSRWDGCSNIKLLKFEGATKFQHYIDSFNCNTNYFASEYIYKRLRFLNNRNFSQFFTLLFLALWHGIRSGYYVTFLNEFLIIYMEKEFESIIGRTKIYERMWNNPISKYFLYFILKMYTIVFMGWSLIPFDVKVFSKWWSIYASLYFSGFLLFLPWAFAYKPLLLSIKHKL